MKIKEIRAFAIDLKPNIKTKPRVPRRKDTPAWVSPVMRYPEFRFRKSDWMADQRWNRTACVVTAEDGTWGLGLTYFSGPVTSIINTHFAPVLSGQNCMATEKPWDMMQRITSHYGSTGLTSYAISALDNALWDLKGQALEAARLRASGRAPERCDILLRQ